MDRGKPRADTPAIRSTLTRIAAALRQHASTEPAGSRKDKLREAADHVDSAIAHMREPGVNPVEAARSCRTALALLEQHDGLDRLLANLDAVIDAETK